MWTLVIAAAWSASPYKDANADVAAELTLPVDREALGARVDDSRELAAIFPEACVREWEHGVDGRGPFRVTHEIQAFRRRLTGRVVAVEPKRVEIDFEGNKGFVTRFLFEPVDGGTKVTLTTYLNAPPAGLRKYYFENVKPEWEKCWAEALRRLGEAP